MKVTDLRRKLIAALVAGGLLAPSAACAADLNTNLVTNADFEAVDFGTTGAYDSPLILNWAGTLQGFAYSHDATGGVPDYANGGPLAGGGSFYFTSNATPGAANINAPGQFFQDIDVSTGPSGTLIATGTAAFKVGAFFSSFAAQGDFGTVHVDFLNSSSVSLGTGTVSDNDTSTWSQNFAGGLIPVGTATVRLSLFGTALAGGPDGYIDNVDFQVTNEVIQPTLELMINRTDGSMTLHNRTGGAENISGYSITSSFESLAPANWRSIADNYDAGSPGPNQVDAQNDWTELTNPNEHGDLSEADLDTGAGASLAHTQSVNLGNAGTWIQTPTEDLVFKYVSGGQVVDGIVTYTGNGDQPFIEGDFNVDGNISALDWAILRTNQHTDLSGKSFAEAYRLGDLTGDLESNHSDFSAFKSLFEAANGAGSFAAMVAGQVPEPSTVILLSIAGLFVFPSLSRAMKRE